MYASTRSYIHQTISQAAQALQKLEYSGALDFSLQWKLDSLPGFFRFHCAAFDLTLNFSKNEARETMIAGNVHIEGEPDILLDGYVAQDGRALLNARSSEFEAEASLLVDARAQSVNLAVTGREKKDGGEWGEGFRWTADCVIGQSGFVLSYDSSVTRTTMNRSRNGGNLALSFDSSMSRSTLALRVGGEKMTLSYDAGVKKAPGTARDNIGRTIPLLKLQATLEQTADGGYTLTYEDTPDMAAPRHATISIVPISPALALPTGEIPAMEIEDAVAAFAISTAEPEPTP